MSVVSLTDSVLARGVDAGHLFCIKNETCLFKRSATGIYSAEVPFTDGFANLNLKTDVANDSIFRLCTYNAGALVPIVNMRNSPSHIFHSTLRIMVSGSINGPVEMNHLFVRRPHAICHVEVFAPCVLRVRY